MTTGNKSEIITEIRKLERAIKIMNEINVHSFGIPLIEKYRILKAMNKLKESYESKLKNAEG